MAERTIYIGNHGPDTYDDADNLGDPLFPGQKRAALITDGEIVVGGVSVGGSTTRSVSPPAGLSIVDIFCDINKGARWDYTVSDGTNIRSGMINAVWDQVSGSTPVYREQSTDDIGDTSGVTFSVVKVGEYVQLKINTPGVGWSVYLNRFLIGAAI